MSKSVFMSGLPGSVRINGPVEERLLIEYGAMFVAKNVTPPTKIVFRDEAEVLEFQANVPSKGETIGGYKMRLQSAAMDDLLLAIEDANRLSLSIAPRGSDSAARTYDETVELWASRVEPGLRHWINEGRITQDDADRIHSMSPFEQVPEILSLEAKGIFFAKDLSKSIIYSVAPPGTSQHLSMLAFDVKEFEDLAVRDVLAKRGWFQTVVSDLPHFTYLGVEESELPSLGLKQVISNGRRFWVPDIYGEDL